MTKVVIIGDTHFSVKNGNEVMLQHQLDFFHKQVIPFCQLNDIKHVWQTGDLFDNRKNTNNIVASRVEALFEHIDSLGIDFRCIVGNHDVPLKNTNEHNTPYTLLKHHIRVNESFKTEKEFSTDFVPWINKENIEDTLSKVSISNSRFCFGHFEFSGFEMQKGHMMQHGMDSSLFRNYELVISGHYHSSSRKDNVLYVGTPIQFTWSDYGEDKGFWVLETETGAMQFIKNPVSLFVKLEYDEDKPLPTDSIENKWVRMYVRNKKDQEKYDNYLESLNKQNPAELKVIEDLVEISESYTIENVDATNALTIMKQYVEQTSFNNLDSEKVFQRMSELYQKALLEQ